MELYTNKKTSGTQSLWDESSNADGGKKDMPVAEVLETGEACYGGWEAEGRTTRRWHKQISAAECNQENTARDQGVQRALGS